MTKVSEGGQKKASACTEKKKKEAEETAGGETRRGGRVLLQRCKRRSEAALSVFAPWMPYAVSSHLFDHSASCFTVPLTAGTGRPAGASAKVQLSHVSPSFPFFFVLETQNPGLINRLPPHLESRATISIPPSPCLKMLFGYSQGGRAKRPFILECKMRHLALVFCLM